MYGLLWLWQFSSFRSLHLCRFWLIHTNSQSETTLSSFCGLLFTIDEMSSFYYRQYSTICVVFGFHELPKMMESDQVLMILACHLTSYIDLSWSRGSRYYVIQNVFIGDVSDDSVVKLAPVKHEMVDCGPPCQ